MGTVKYSGPVASFHCPTNAEIRSLKVHFSPKQEGSGDPSPENVREIVGWDGVQVEQSRRNLFDANNPNIIVPNCWVSSSAPNKITASNVDRTVYIKCLPNTTYVISKTIGNVLAAGYTTELPATSIQTYSYIRDTANAQQVTVTTGADAQYLAIWVYDGSKAYDRTVQPEDIYKTLQVEYGTVSNLLEPYHGSTTNYEFGVLGKNKLDKNSYKYLNGSIICFGGGTSSEPDGSLFLKAGTYTFSVNTTATLIFASNANKINIVSATNINTATFTLPESTAIRIGCFIQNATDEEMLAYNYQLELGSSATTYEPYDPNKTVYGGWVDLISGEVQEGTDGYPYDTIILDGTENWTLVNQNDSTTIFKYTYGGKAKTESKSICSHFKMQLLSYRDLGYTNCFVHGLSGNLFIQPTNSIASTVEEFQTYLASQYQNGTPVTVLFQANKTPNTYHLAPTELQTFLGHNNVWSNADYVEVEYDLHETQDILARKQFIIANQPHTVKASGSLVNFETDMAAALKECKVHFGPIQEGSGDPSPDNVRAINGWTGLEVTRCGKNLFNKDTVINNSWIRAENLSEENPLGTIRENARGYTLSSYIPVYSNTTYTIKYNITSLATAAGMVFFSEQDANSAISGISLYYQTYINSSITREYYTFTTPTNCHYIRITTPPNASEVQLELGSTATDYEPYNGITIPITFPTEAGTVYGGYVDLVRGEVWETYYKFVVDGTLTPQAGGSSYNGTEATNRFFWIPRKTSHTSPTVTADDDVYCDKAINLKRGTWTSPNSRKGEFCLNSFTQLHIVFTNEDVGITEENTAAERTALIKAWLADNPMTFVLPLQVPALVTTLTPTQLKTLRGTNNLWSNSNDNIEIAYWKH